MKKNINSKFSFIPGEAYNPFITKKFKTIDFYYGFILPTLYS